MNDLLYNDFVFYLIGIVVLVAVFFMLKKVASCLIKSIVMIVIIAILGAVYYLYLM